MIETMIRAGIAATDTNIGLTDDRDERPPGWSHGKKTGWGNCGLPPGQAKKYGCRTYVYEGRPQYYYQDEVGRIIVRRPILEVHGSVVIH